MPEKLPTVKDYLQDDEWERLNIEICPHEWISVKDRLPGNNSVLVYMTILYPEIKIAYCHDTRWYINHIEWPSDEHITQYVTHWMPLPEPPKELKNI